MPPPLSTVLLAAADGDVVACFFPRAMLSRGVKQGPGYEIDR